MEDTFFGHRCPMFVRALIQYIKEGGALFSTHDQFDETHSRFIFFFYFDMLQLLVFIQVY